MSLVVQGTIRGTAKRYADGTEIMEIWVPTGRASGLPYSNDIRVPIDLEIDGRHYSAGLKATERNKYVWISPDVKTTDDVPAKLAHILASAGFKKNDKVLLVTDGTNIKMKAATDGTFTPLMPEEIEHPEKYIEGASKKIFINAYERNTRARNACIAHYGSTCVVCSFNFEIVYGEIGAGFIHVHHLLPLSEIKMQYELDPIRDLRPVCPNCHAIIHSAQPAFTIEQLKGLLGREKNA